MNGYGVLRLKYNITLNFATGSLALADSSYCLKFQKSKIPLFIFKFCFLLQF